VLLALASAIVVLVRSRLKLPTHDGRAVTALCFFNRFIWQQFPQLPDDALQASGVILRQTIPALTEKSRGSRLVGHFLYVLFHPLELVNPEVGLSESDFPIKPGNLLDSFSQAVGFVITNDFLNFGGQFIRSLFLLIVAILASDFLQPAEPIACFGDERRPLQSVGCFIKSELEFQ
jgi:hypothetical protein